MRSPDDPQPAPAAEVARGESLFFSEGCIECQDGPRGSGRRPFTYEEIGTADEILTVSGTDARPLDGAFGRGINVEDGASVVGTRIRIEENREVGIFVASNAASGTFADAVVSGTLEQACATTTCVGREFGMGIGSYLGATLDLTNFIIEESPLCGVQIALDGQVDLREGEVTGSAIGACVQVDGYDLDRLQDMVSYLDNETNLDSVTLPVPDVASP